MHSWPPMLHPPLKFRRYSIHSTLLPEEWGDHFSDSLEETASKMRTDPSSVLEKPLPDPTSGGCTWERGAACHWGGGLRGYRSAPCLKACQHPHRDLPLPPRAPPAERTVGAQVGENTGI